MRAVQHGDIRKAVRLAASAARLQHPHAADHPVNLFREKQCFGKIVRCAEQSDRIAVPAGRAQRFCVRQDRGGTFQDLRCGAVILFQTDLPYLREILRELFKAQWIRTAEPVDRLVGIPYHEKPLSRLCPCPDQTVLQRADILKFVDEQPGERAEQLRLSFGIAAEQRQSPQKNIVVVHQMLFGEIRVVLLQNRGKLLILPAGGDSALELRQIGQHGARRSAVSSVPAETLHECKRIGIAEDPGIVPGGAQGRETDGMERADLRRSGDLSASGLRFQSMEHLSGGALCKGDGGDLRRADPEPRHQIQDFCRERAGFPGSRSSDYGHCALRCGDGFLLSVVERSDQIFRFTLIARADLRLLFRFRRLHFRHRFPL